VFVDWLEARLDGSSLQKLDAHLDTCGTCRVLFAELSRLHTSSKDSERSVEIDLNERTPPTKPSNEEGAKTASSPAAIGRFVVERMLGEGGMGTVFVARDPDLDRLVAVKVLKAGGDDARLVEEARSQAQLAHPNVVRVYEVGHGSGGLYIAMELVEGGTLRDWLRREPHHWTEVVAAFEAAGRGLVAAHRAGLVHRDFKPSNVLVGTDGRIAVTDFGLARSESRPERPRRAPTQTGMLVGTPAFLAPEQFRGERATELSDQFSFAISLYQGLYGMRPFEGRDSDEIMANVLAGRIAPAPDGTEVPVWLREIVLRGLALDPAHRFPSVEALLLAIDEKMARRSLRRDCPFPGLAAFDITDSDVYFGRDAEIAEAARRVAETGFLAVVGPSGSGKSSFVRAGLVPALRAQSRVVEFLIRPGPAPRKTLEKLYADVGEDTGVAHAERLGAALAAYATANQCRVVLVVDQLEELFTLSHDAEQHALFVDSLDAIAAQYSDRVRCIVTLRSDLLERAQSHRRFLRRVVGSLLFLTNPDRETLRDAVVRPLAHVGYSLESTEIAESIAAELEGKPGALPLLQFTARSLWSQADHDRKLVTNAAYRGLGELAGLLAAHATSVMTALGPADRALAREILVRLVTPERTRAVVPVVDLQGLGPEQDVAHVMEALVHARLVVVNDNDSASTAELVHESLIDRWPALRRWLDELDQGDALFAEVSEAARRWSARGRPPGLLWQGETARRLERFRQSHRGTLTEDEDAFVGAVLGGEHRRVRRRRWALTGAFATLGALVVGAIVTILWIREAADAATDAAVEARAAEAKASEQERAARVEAARAQAAERTVAEQLEALKLEQRERAAAEQRVSSTTQELSLTHEELQKALAAAHREAARATKASAAAEEAARSERTLRTQIQRQLAEKEAELHRERAKINVTLKGAGGK
jgi:hypothetical protein